MIGRSVPNLSWSSSSIRKEFELSEEMMVRSGESARYFYTVYTADTKDSWV